MYQLSMSSVLQQLAWAGGRAGILTDNWFTGANIAAIFVLMRTNKVDTTNRCEALKEVMSSNYAFNIKIFYYQTLLYQISKIF